MQLETIGWIGEDTKWKIEPLHLHLEKSYPRKIWCICFQEPQVLVWLLHREEWNRVHCPKQQQQQLTKNNIFCERKEWACENLDSRGCSLGHSSSSQGLPCADCIRVGTLSYRCLWSTSVMWFPHGEESLLKPVRRLTVLVYWHKLQVERRGLPTACMD